MNLHAVTFTGVDNGTNLDRLLALSREYPFVEWGLLLSTKRTGIDARYPTLARLERIGEMDVRKSVHLCGSLARDAAACMRHPVETALQLVMGASRVQINLGAGIESHPRLYAQSLRLACRFGIQVIVQAHSFTTRAVLAAEEGGPLHIHARSLESCGVTFLHDASGGRGISGRFEKPVNGDFAGFAGGISPENVEKKLEQIAALVFANPFWIDIETGVRTEDVFDMDKVEQVLRRVKPFVNADAPAVCGIGAE